MRLVSALVIAIALAAVLAAQQQQPTFKAGISFVRVDVYPSVNGRIVSDLKQDEFEVLEDGVPQKIESFEHIAARAPGAEVERSEPRSQQESNDAAADPRNRLFVLFFDTFHTIGYDKPKAIEYDPRTAGRALAAWLDQLIGPDDLVGILRPEMPVDTLAFTRRPSSFAEFLQSGGEWQRRFVQQYVDDTEINYELCYPVLDLEVSDIAPAMIARRREMLMLDGLRSLVTHLQNLREGRKAVIVVSEGWTLFTPDEHLARPVRGQMPNLPPIGVISGQPTAGGDRNAPYKADCERDRMNLAHIDNEKDFRRMLDDANRANVTFYPVDPGGLRAPGGMTPTQTKRQVESLKTLATATDGIAVADNNDFTPGLQRIRDDLSSYYLLGYNSTNTKFDGRFRTITVRVRRPGVDVRARRGYTAPTEAEVALRAKAEAPPDPDVALRETALSMLGEVRPDRPLHVAAGYGFDAPTSDAQGPQPVLWVTGELESAAARQAEWSSGGAATISISSGGQVVSTERASVTAAAPWFSVRVSAAKMKPGDYLVSLKVVGKAAGAADATTQVAVSLPDPSRAGASVLGQPMLLRRGPYTGPVFYPTADRRFRRAERIRVDVPLAAAAESATAQLLDRKGQPLSIPVTATLHDDAGQRSVTAEAGLAALAPGDYLIAVAATKGTQTTRVLAAFRIVP